MAEELKRWRPVARMEDGEPHGYMIGDKAGTWAWADDAERRIVVLSQRIAELEATATQAGEPGRCGQPAGPAISPFHWWVCELPTGHEGEHKRGGNCTVHGSYVGEQCPLWPECIKRLAKASVRCADCGKPISADRVLLLKNMYGKKWKSICYECRTDDAR